MEEPKLAVDRERLLATLQEMIRIESVNPSLVEGGSGERRIAAWLAERLSALGLETRLHEIAPGRFNVVGVLKGTGGGRTLLLNGHLDTVGLEGMTIDPLGGELREGRVYGRGSLDMKGGLAAALAAVEAVAGAADAPRPAPGRGGTSSWPAWPTRSTPPSGRRRWWKEYRADGAVVCEPSGLELGVAHKGFAWVRIDVHGRAAHGSRPDLGVDAIVKTGRVLAGLEALGERLRGRTHALLGSPSLHASLIQGGRELSTYPDSCRLQLERRTIPGEDRAAVEAEIGSLLAGIRAADPDFRADSELFFYRPTFEVSPREPVAAALAAACERQLGSRPRLCGFSGWLDSSILAGAGIPTVIYGPGGEGLHAAVEWVDLDSVAAAAQALAALILDFCR